MGEQRLQIEWREGAKVSAALNPADGGPGFVLAHGAGGNMETAFLADTAAQLATRGFPALRFNFPYTEARRRIPDPAATLEACYRAVAVRANELFPSVVLGGKSMGGRIASQMIAQPGAPSMKGLAFLGYPLHPPGKPEKLRDQHLYGIGVPMLFIEGTRDAFATRKLLTGVLERLGTVAEVHWIEGADHSFRVSGRKPAAVNEEILDVLSAFLRRVA